MVRVPQLCCGWAQLSYVRGCLIDLNDEPLPRLPPLQGHLGLTCEPTEALSATIDLRVAVEQNRIGEFEEPTEGYAVLDLSSQYYAQWGPSAHLLLDLGKRH